MRSNMKDRMAFEVYIEEYKRHFNEIMQRVGFRQNILKTSIILMSIIVAVFINVVPAFFKESIEVNLAIFILLIVPIPFYALSMVNCAQYLMISFLAEYINKVLREKIMATIDGSDILEWENFLSKRKMCNPKLTRMTKLCEGYILFLIPVLCIICFVILVVYNMNNINYKYSALMFILNMLLFYISLYSNIVARTKYKEIT